MIRTLTYVSLFFIGLNSINQMVQAQTVHGILSVWHTTSIDFEGPNTSELATPNPFTDYRLDVIFTGPSDQRYKVAGFYAADGNAGETSADSGNTWRVRFTPDEEGIWNYQVAFVSGTMIAAQISGGESAGYFDGVSGSFKINASSNNSDIDFRSKGKLVYNNQHYLKFIGSGDYFLKAGANSPEVFLEYAEFDNTPSQRLYATHIADFNESEDPSWQNGKGKGIIGALNYLSNTGVNALYFLTMNAYGDGKNSWPWVNQDSIYVYDVSKLEQWEIVFKHMTKKGIMPHFVLTETENESYFEMVEDGVAGGFADSRKIYYREMIARFGHHPALTWNIGEENGWEDPSTSLYKKGNTDSQRIDAANYIRSLTYYEDHISIHNGPSDDDHIFDALLGESSLTGPAFQWDFGTEVRSKILEWKEKSAQSNHKWVVNIDEAYVNPPLGSLSTWLKDINWGTFMAGGAGVELYIGSGLDLQIENYRDYEAYYEGMVKVKNLFLSLPFQQMQPMDSLASNGWVFAKPDSVYVFYKTSGTKASLYLPEGTYQLKWINPTTIEFADEEPTIINGDTLEILETPFGLFSNGVAIITKVDSISTSSEVDDLLPTGFNLYQNYPNPFNPSTRITYDISEADLITLSVYDALGRQVKQLVNSYQTPDTYHINFTGDKLTSGIYFYTLNSGNQKTETRKMLLIK